MKGILRNFILLTLILPTLSSCLSQKANHNNKSKNDSSKQPQIIGNENQEAINRPISVVLLLEKNDHNGLNLTGGLGKALNNTLGGRKPLNPGSRTTPSSRVTSVAQTTRSNRLLRSFTAPSELRRDVTSNNNGVASSIVARPTESLKLTENYKTYQVGDLDEVKPFIVDEPVVVVSTRENLQRSGFSVFPGEFRQVNGINYKVIGQNESQFLVKPNLNKDLIDETNVLESLFDQRAPEISGINKELADSGGSIEGPIYTIRFKRKIAEGGQGAAYESEINGRSVVIKNVNRKDDIARETYFGERMDGSLYSAKLHGSFKGDDGSFFIVSEYVPNSFKELPLNGKMIDELFSGLEEIHSRGIVHHDIKPDNILSTADFKPKYIDFGVSAKKSSPSFRAGSADFMSRNGIILNGVDRDLLGLGLSIAVKKYDNFDLEFYGFEAHRLKIEKEFNNLPPEGRDAKINEWIREITADNKVKQQKYQRKKSRVSQDIFHELVKKDLASIRGHASKSDAVLDYMRVRGEIDKVDKFLINLIEGKFKTASKAKSAAKIAFESQ